MHKTIVFAILVLMWFEGCVIYGPKAEHKSTLDYLDGENYDNGPDGTANRVIVTIVKTKVRESTVSGEVLLGSSLAEMPLKGVVVELVTAGTVVALSSTDVGGVFVLKGEFKNGDYLVRVHSDQFGGETPFEITKYETGAMVVHSRRATSAGS